MSKYAAMGFIVSFWLIMYALFGFFGYALDTGDAYKDETWLNKDKLEDGGLYGTLNQGFDGLFLFKAMFWTVDESYDLPTWVYIFIDLLAIMTLIITFIILYPFAD